MKTLILFLALMLIAVPVLAQSGGLIGSFPTKEYDPTDPDSPLFTAGPEPPVVSQIYYGVEAGAVFNFLAGEGDSLALNGNVAYVVPGDIWLETGFIAIGQVNPTMAFKIDLGKGVVTFGDAQLVLGGSYLRDQTAAWGGFGFVKVDRLLFPWLTGRVGGRYLEAGGGALQAGLLVREIM